ncbi:MAG: YceI family protein [Flavobacterium sp.]
MKIPKNQSLLLTFILALINLSAIAQKNYTLDTKTNFSVQGTSTLHDWEMTSAAKTGTANLTVNDTRLENIHAITIDLAVETIKSGKSAMDKIAYETLNAKKFKTIKYVLKSATKINETTWNLVGTYTIAGVNKDIKTQIRVSVLNGIVTLQGSNKITFEEFGMKAPTALLGTIKTGKDLTLKFNLNYK